ncbi:unnamed protein product [Blepharisma stoltei]|uniref:TMEM131L fifth Ig-like domain-containing protein n=1 Tax=Blepharisma stoltei TaxID=1481888 RepID=A0AAU9JT17_9CILI|nr:unnamed protein product [Blepharisma stoltei]
MIIKIFIMTFIIALVWLISTILDAKSYSQLHWASKLLPHLSNNSQHSKSPWPFIRLNESKLLLYPIKCNNKQQAKISKIEIDNYSMYQIFENLPKWLKYYWLDVFESPSSLFPKIFVKANSKENKLKKNLKSIRFRDMLEFTDDLHYKSSELDIGNVYIEHQIEKNIEFENNSDESLLIELFLAPANFSENIKWCKNEFIDEDEFENLPRTPECNKNNEIEIIKTLTQRNSSKLKRVPENISLYGKVMSGLGYGNNTYNEVIISKEKPEKKSVEFPFYLGKRGGVVVPPHSVAFVGTVIFQPTQSKKYYASLFMRNGSKLLKEIKLSGEGISYKLSFLESDSGNLNFHIDEMKKLSDELYYSRVFTLFNSGQVQALVKGIYLDGISCQMHGLKLHPCGQRIEIAPGDYYHIEIFYEPDFHEFLGNYHIEIYTEIEKIEVGINLNFPIANFENSFSSQNLFSFVKGIKEIERFFLFFFSFIFGLSLTAWQEIRIINRKNCKRFYLISSKLETKEDFNWISNSYDPPYFSQMLPKNETKETPDSELSKEMPEKVAKPKKAKRKPIKFSGEIFEKPPMYESHIIANSRFLPKKQVKAEFRHSIISDANTVASCTSGTNLNNSMAENENSPSVTWHTEDDLSEIALDDEDYFLDAYRAENGLFSGPFVQRSYIFENDLQVSFE